MTQCCEAMYDKIYQCKAGHMYCKACQPKLQKCPTCQVPLSRRAEDAIRNRGLEAVADEVEETCKYECGQTIRLPQSDKHYSSECLKRPYHCRWYEEKDGVSCGFSGKVNELAAHLVAAHAVKEEQSRLDSLVTLGCRYYDGNGVVQDNKKAVELFQQAANQGHAEGQCNLGAMYRDGRCVAQDDKKAVELFQQAAKQGEAAAQCNLGWMYRRGRGVAQDDKKAVELYQQAANQGHTLGAV